MAIIIEDSKLSQRRVGSTRVPPRTGLAAARSSAVHSNVAGKRHQSTRQQSCAAAFLRSAGWLGVLPFAWLALELLTDRLGADPVATIIANTGTWSLRMLWASLAITPIRGLFGWQWLGPLRRTLGLLGFFYACLHVTAYLLFEWEFDFGPIWDSAIQWAHLSVGWLCFLLLIPLALTSRDSVIRQVGGRNWRRLHRLAYLCAILAGLHFVLLSKRNIDEPGLYLLVLCLLFYFRLPGITKSIREKYLKAAKSLMAK